MQKESSVIARNEWLDVAKGITIVLMVIGHTSIPLALSNFIWAFHMPLFFIASGLSSNWTKYTFKSYVLRKCRVLLFPFIIYSIIDLGILSLLEDYSVLEWLKYGWRGYALWFIPVLFLASIFSLTIMSIKNNIILNILWLLTGLIGATLSYFSIKFPWTLSSVPYACFLIILGGKLIKLKSYIDMPRWWILLLGFIITFFISRFSRLDMASNNITPITVLTIGAVAGTFMIFTIASYISRYAKCLSKMLQVIGKETYLILAFSQIIILCINHYLLVNSIAKYLLLVVVLIVIRYIKSLFSCIFIKL